jgi:hypothetical protein
VKLDPMAMTIYIASLRPLEHKGNRRQGDAKACTRIEWRNGSVPVGIVENASKGRLGTLATRVTEPYQLRLDIVEHISNLWKLQGTPLMENKKPMKILPVP